MTTRSRWFAAAACVSILAAAAAFFLSPRPGGEAPVGRSADTHSAGQTPTRGGVVTGLTSEGAGPSLSWNLVEGAYDYHVTVSGPDGPWTWEGPSPPAVYGTLENALDPVLRPDRPPVQVLAARPGARYRWTVTAFTPEGEVSAVSEVASFVYQTPSPGAPLPARRPRRARPTLDCALLIPDSMTKGRLAGYSMEEETPCGLTLAPGCPLVCGFSRKDGRRTTRVAFTYACDGSQWESYPKPDGGAALDGVGRHAVIAEADGRATLLFLSSSTPCLIQVRSSLGREATIELARGADRHLEPATVFLPDTWR